MKILFILLFFFAIASCQSSRTVDVERLSIVPKVIVNDLETVMPGQLSLTDRYLLWTDPLNHEYGIHVVDKITGQELNKIAPKGNGPEEFISPNISIISGDSFLIYDNASNKIIIVSENTGERKINWNNKEQLQNITRLVLLENGHFITFSPEKMFSLMDSIGTIYSSFGVFPFEKEIDNSFDVYQGEVVYNPLKKALVYSTYKFPYIALYKEEGDGFVLKNQILESGSCEIVNGSLKCDKSIKGAKELALTKEYIVTLERDYSSDPTDESTVGRDFSKSPKTVFLYDYNLNLKKIIDLGMPIIRLAGNPLTNEIYAIGIDPDFAIVKFEI